MLYSRPKYALNHTLDKSYAVEEEMRNAGRLKLGYYPLPVEEAQNIRALLMSFAPYSAIDPCAGDGTALLEITKDTGAHLAGIELDADRAAAATEMGIAAVHGSAFECRRVFDGIRARSDPPYLDVLTQYKEDGTDVLGTLLSLGDQ